MRKILLSGVAVAALAGGPAAAADMTAPAYKAPTPPAPTTYNWTGFYVGAGYGYGLSDADTSVFTSAFGLTSTNVSNAGKGWLGLATAGYDYQFTDHLVAGVFADYDFTDIHGTLSVPLATGPSNTLAGTEKENAAWYVGARIGWLLTPTLLTYWNGGYSQARFGGVNLTGTGGGAVPPGLATQANTYNGWFVGGGMEAQLTFLPVSGWFVRTEYTYASYRSDTLPIANSAASVFGASSLTIRPAVQTIVTGLTYKFNWTP